MKSIFLMAVWATLMVFAFNGCGKPKSSKPYSVWYVNGMKYQSNDLKVDIGHNVAYMSAYTSDGEGFQFVFNEGGLPQSGNLLFDCDTPYSNHVCVRITHDNTTYGATTIFYNYLHASSQNSLPIYTIDSVWFVKHTNPNDSVLIKGTFIGS